MTTCWIIYDWQGLQNDLRSLLTYIKEAYDSVFRRVVMSGVMESQQCPPSSIILPQPSSQAGTSLHIKSRPDTPTTLQLQLHQQASHSHKRKPLVRHSRLDSEPSRAAHDDNDHPDNIPFNNDVNVNTQSSAGYLRGIFAKKQKVSLKPMQSRENSESNLKGDSYVNKLQ